MCLIAEGKWNEAEQQFRIALGLAETLSNEHYVRLIAHNLALAPGFRGDFGEALRWFNRIFLEGKPEKQLPQEAIGHLNVARLLLYRGELEKCESHLERALEIASFSIYARCCPKLLKPMPTFIAKNRISPTRRSITNERWRHTTKSA